MAGVNSSCSSCNGVYLACRQLLVDVMHRGRSDAVVVGFGSSEDSNNTSPDVVTRAEGVCMCM